MKLGQFNVSTKQIGQLRGARAGFRKQTPCLKEFTALMKCWKGNEFDNSGCKEAAATLAKCQAAAKAQVNRQKLVSDTTNYHLAQKFLNRKFK